MCGGADGIAAVSAEWEEVGRETFDTKPGLTDGHLACRALWASVGENESEHCKVREVPSVGPSLVARATIPSRHGASGRE